LDVSPSVVDQTRFLLSHFPSMKFLLQSCLLGLALNSFGAGWPARLFAPYMFIGAGDHFQITQCDDACGQKYFTLAFIIANQQNQPAWDGRFALDQNLYAGQINAIRRRGGDVIVSFGGADGQELALGETNLTMLTAKYQSVIDRYHFTWLDFDIEGETLKKQAVNQRRNAVLARLQAKNPALLITFTVPVDPDGIPDSALTMLADAKYRGVKIYSANVMTMDYGRDFSSSHKMADISIASTLKARGECLAIDPAIRIGLTPMIGVNDAPGETFTLEDARALKAWADQQPWICSLSFWASNRDTCQPGEKGNGNLTSGIPQQTWEFSRIFESFASGPEPFPAPLPNSIR
jgi:hypothetical protein